MTPWRLRDLLSRHRLLSAAGSVLVLIVPAALAMTSGQGQRPVNVALSDGAIWMPSPTAGLVTRLDGPSRQVTATLRVSPGRPDQMQVSQAGADAFVANSADGTVTRIDGTRYVTSAVRFSEPGSGVQALTGSDPATLYVVDVGRRTAALVDPPTLRITRSQGLGARPGPGQSVVDDQGRLWVVDADRGGLSWVDGQGKHVAAGTVDRTDRLVLVQGQPALVDLARGRVSPLSDAGTADRWSCLDVRSADSVRLAGSGTASTVFAVVHETGTVVQAQLGHDDCSSVVQVGRQGDTYGTPVEAGPYLLVPNISDGKTYVVDTHRHRVVSALPLATAGHQLELTPKDGLVFYNDLDGEQAGVLTLVDGTWVNGKSLRKYDPHNPDGGVLSPAQAQSNAAPAGAVPQSHTVPARTQPTPQTTRAPPPPGGPSSGANGNPGGGSNGGGSNDGGSNGGGSGGGGASGAGSPNTVRLTLARLDAAGSATVTPAPGAGNASCDASAGSCTWAFPSGRSVTLTVSLGAGRQLKSWTGPCAAATGAGQNNGTCQLQLDQDANVAVQTQPGAAPGMVALNVVVIGAGAVTVGGLPSGPATCTGPTPCPPQTAPANTAVSLQSGPSQDWTWNGAPCGPGSNCTFILQKDMTVTATHTPNVTYNLTVAWGTGGAVMVNGKACAMPCVSPQPAGATVNLQAIPTAGWQFTSWAGDSGCSGTNPTCSPTVTSNMSAVATFTALPMYTLTVTPPPSGGTIADSSGGINCPGACTNKWAAGTSIKLIATASAGYRFGSLTAPCSGTPCSFTLSGDTSISVAFVQQHTISMAGVSIRTFVADPPNSGPCPKKPCGTWEWGAGSVTVSAPAANPTCSVDAPPSATGCTVSLAVDDGTVVTLSATGTFICPSSGQRVSTCPIKATSDLSVTVEFRFLG